MTTNTTPYEELRSGQLFAIGRELYQVSTVLPNMVRAQWLLPVQNRTRVVGVDRKDYEMNAKVPGKAIMAHYELAYGLPRSEA